MSKGNKQAVIDGLTRGWSTAEIIAANPDLNPKSLQCTASRLRKELCFDAPLAKSGRALPLPDDLHAAYQREASARKFRSGHHLLLQVASIVVRDNLFNSLFARRYRSMTKWTAHADALLTRLVREGNSFREIAQEMPGTSCEAIRARVRRLRQRGIEMPSWDGPARGANASKAAKARWAKVYRNQIEVVLEALP